MKGNIEELEEVESNCLYAQANILGVDRTVQTSCGRRHLFRKRRRRKRRRRRSKRRRRKRRRRRRSKRRRRRSKRRRRRRRSRRRRMAETRLCSVPWCNSTKDLVSTIAKKPVFAHSLVFWEMGYLVSWVCLGLEELEGLLQAQFETVTSTGNMRLLPLVRKIHVKKKKKNQPPTSVPSQVPPELPTLSKSVYHTPRFTRSSTRTKTPPQNGENKLEEQEVLLVLAINAMQRFATIFQRKMARLFLPHPPSFTSEYFLY